MVVFVLNPSRSAWAQEVSGFFARAYANNSVPREIIGKTYAYVWENGLVDYVEAIKVSRKEAAEMMKNSAGFLGCDWMIHSILTRGEIVDRRIVREEWNREVKEILREQEGNEGKRE